MIDNGLYVDREVTRHASVINTVAPTASPAQVATASAKRVRIVFITDGTNLVTIGQQNPLDGGRVFRLPTSRPLFVMDIADYGSLIQGNWFAQTNVANSNLAVIDVVES